MKKDKVIEEKEECPLCPSSGPPTPPLLSAPHRSSLTPPPPSDADVVADSNAPDTVSSDLSPSTPSEMLWIACSKCNKWYHSACVLLAGEDIASTVPKELRDEATTDNGPWFDWPSKVDRWYCRSCIEYSTSPANPRPPRQPLIATVKKQHKAKVDKRESDTHNLGLPATKKVRRQSNLMVESTPLLNNQGANGGESTIEPSEGGRPKRQAALDRPDYYNMHHHNATPTKTWLNLIKDPEKYGRIIKEDNFPRVPGSLLKKEWIEASLDPNNPSPSYPSHLPPTLFYGPTRQPVVVRPEDGGIESMGGMVPDKGLTVDHVAQLVGPQKLVDVIDVATQQSTQWTLEKWATYVKSRLDPKTASSSKVYNIISLEISGTELAKKVRPPRIVSDIDWVDNFWHFPDGKETTMRAAARASATAESTRVTETSVPKPKARSEWPKVQLYCLMGSKDSWTDWHVDFAASSVYYSIHTGSKVFFFIRPTEANLAAYAQWSGSHELQQSKWLPDMCDEVRKVTLMAGDTMILPSGYIHAVYTPVDSIVFGGNFLHSYDIPTQLRLRQIEIDTKVPQRFRFPLFDQLCWYVAERYRSDLRLLRAFRPSGKPSNVSRPHERVLRGLMVLAKFLIGQVEAMEDVKTDDKRRRLIWSRIPSEVTDAGGLAHELLWRVEKELPDLEADEDEVKVGVGETGKVKDKEKVGKKTNGGKNAVKYIPLFNRPKVSRTWRFFPTPWEQEDRPIIYDTKTVMRPRPASGGGWIEPRSEEAEETTSVHHQSRKRVRIEAGETVLEEQELIFTERRVVWVVPGQTGQHGHQIDEVNEAGRVKEAESVDEPDNIKVEDNKAIVFDSGDP